MSRSALPQNYVKDTGTLFEGFEDSSIGTGAGYTWYLAGSTGRTATVNTTQFLTGTQSIKLYAPASGSMSVTKNISQVFSGIKNIEIAVYLHTAITSITKVTVFLSSASTRPVNTSGPYAKSIIYAAQLSQAGATGGVGTGWNRILLSLSDFTLYNGELWSNTMQALQITLDAASGVECYLSVDDMRISSDRIPKILVQFDDVYTSAYEEAYSYMGDRGIRGTLSVIPTYIAESGFLTLPQLQTMYAAGWAMANHTYTHPSGSLVGLSLAEQTTEIQDGASWLLNNGFPRAAYHVAYPVGAADDNTYTAMANLGMLTGRLTNNYEIFLPLSNPYRLQARVVTAATSVATVTGIIDNITSKGGSYALVFHNLVDSSPTGTQYTKANFETIIDYLVSRRVSCVTIDEFYGGITDPRLQSIPPSRSAAGTRTTAGIRTSA